MATSGSTDFSISGDDIIKYGLLEIGAIAVGETPSDAEMVHGRKKLNMLVKQWMGPNSMFAPGLKMWARERATLTLTAKNTFELKPTGGDLDIAIPVSILSAVRRNTDDVDTPLKPMTLDEYEALGTKSETGTPTKFYYERQLDAGYLYLNMVPDDTTDTIPLVYLRILEDFDSADDTPDFPQEWYRPLVYNLALELAPGYGVTASRGLQALAASSLAMAQTFHPDSIVTYYQSRRDD